MGDELGRRHEAPDPPAPLLDRRARPQRDLVSAALDRDCDRVAAAAADPARHLLERARPVAVDRENAVTRPEPGGGGRCARLDLGDLGARALGWRSRRVHREENDESDEHIHAGARGDREDALPGRLAPVRVRTGTVVDVAHRLLGGAARRRAELRLPERSAECGQLRPSAVEVAGGERALLRCGRRAESRVLVERRLHDGGEVSCGRPLHPGDTHVAAERDRPDPVLDPVPADGDERGREADVKGTRLHPDEPRDREVAQLVQEDERCEAEDDD